MQIGEIQENLEKLDKKRGEQIAQVQKKHRQHHLCLVEIIRNLNELEEMTGLKVDL